MESGDKLPHLQGGFMEADIKPKRLKDYLEELIIMIEATDGEIAMSKNEKAYALECIMNSDSYIRLKEFISETY